MPDFQTKSMELKSMPQSIIVPVIVQGICAGYRTGNLCKLMSLEAAQQETCTGLRQWLDGDYLG